MKNEPSLSGDGRGLLMLGVLALAALLLFGIPAIFPPRYVMIGPIEIGELANTTCHGVGVGGTLIFKTCK
jgi:hypothetical protein